MVDKLAPVGMREIAGMHAVNPNVVVKKDGAKLIKKIQERRAEKQSPKAILVEVANGREAVQGKATQTYQLDSGQQDAARFGGDGGKLNANGQAENKDNITTAQEKRRSEGQTAIENVSSVLYYMDILNLPENKRDAEITRLNGVDKSFAKLGISNKKDLANRAATAMLSDSGIQKLIATMPGTDPKDIVLETMLTDPQFRETVSEGFQKIHEKLLNLPPVTPEGNAKDTLDLNQANKIVADKALDIATRLDRAQKAGKLPNPMTADEIKAVMEGSTTEKDFRANLARKMGVNDVDSVSQYAANEAEIARINKLLESRLDDIITVDKTEDTTVAGIKQTKEKPTVTEGPQRGALTKEVGRLALAQTTLEGADPDMKGHLSIYKSVVAFCEDGDVKADIVAGVRSSVDAIRIKSNAGAASSEISTSLNTRLDKEDVLIKEMNSLLGESLGASWGDQMDKTSADREEILNKQIEEASTEHEKELLRKLQTRYVEYDAAKRETTIHGDEIMEGMKLLAMQDRGVMVEQARAMGFLTDKQVSDIFDIGPGDEKKGETASYMQKKYIDGLLGGLDADQKLVLDKMFKDHGAEQRQKMYGSYLVMDQYLKENGILGFAIRHGRNVTYEGPIRKLIEMYNGKGDSTVNKDELALISQYCQPDIDAAVSTNKAANTFLKRMEAQGMVGNPDLLKKLAWLIFVVLGLGGGGIAAALPAGLGALGGAGVGAGLGGVGLGAAKVLENKTVAA